MLRPAEFLGDGQLDLHFLGFGEIVASDLVPGVGQRFLELLAERKVDAGQAGLFLQLALCAGELILAGLDEPLREIPVAVRAQQKEVRTALRATEYHHAGRARRRFAFHAAILLENGGRRMLAARAGPSQRRRRRRRICSDGEASVFWVVSPRCGLWPRFQVRLSARRARRASLVRKTP